MRWIVLLLILLCRCLPVSAQEPVKGLLIIPAIQMVAPVIEIKAQADGNYDLTGLGDGVGWLQYAAWLNNDFGRIDLVGHTPGGFEQVRELQVGDLIILSDRERVEWYRVELTTLVKADDVSWLLQEGPERVVLITCEGNQRRIVEAERIN